jgi:hypothetical protein
MQPCLDEAELMELAAGHFAGDRLGNALEHVERCAVCRDLVAFAARSLAELAAARPGESPAGATPSSEAAIDEAEGLRALALVDADRFELRGEVARGGMGAIFEAWDRRHQRRVAIKMLLRKSAGAARRFVREARIGVRLQHPGIVPVHETGRWIDGEPFFVMKLVEGRSLAAAIAERADLAGRLALLPNLIAAVDALAYAHAQGVIHRDLKPANVLLGEYGDTVVVDWGLAREMGADAEEPASDERAGAEGPTLTAAGTALGTPAYMAPEQARGERVCTGADVYSLGAMLYHLLAGAPPYQGKSVGEVLALVRAGPPPAIAGKAPDAPRDLAAVVERAMERTAARRYPTAKELVDDLRRFAEGRLVSAHSYSLPALLRRWALRHRGAVAVGGVALLALALTALLSYGRIVRERDRADALARLSARQRDAAEGLAQFMVGELRKQLAAVGRLQLFSGIGSQVDAYYRSLAGDEAGGVEALARRASALEMLAEVEAAKNDHPAALERVREALALRQRAVSAAPSDPEQRARLAETLLRLGRGESDLGKAAPSLEAEREAVAIAQELVATYGKSERFQLLLVEAQRDLAVDLGQHGDTTGAIEARRAVRDTLARRVAADPDSAELTSQLADALLYLGQIEINSSRYADALASETQALAAYDRLLARDADNAGWQEARSRAVQLLAASHLYRSEPEEGLLMYRRCTEARERLVAADPANERYKRYLSFCLDGLAWAYRDLRLGAEARAAGRRALRMHEEAAAAHPESWEAQRAVALTLRELVMTDLVFGDDAQALAGSRSALRIVEALLRSDAHTMLKYTGGELHLFAGEAQLRLGRAEGALASALAAGRMADELVATAPSDGDNRALRARSRALLGEVQARRGRSAEGRRLADAANQDLAELWASGEERTEWVQTAPQVARAMARALVAVGDRAAAGARLTATLASVDQLKAAGKLPARDRADVGEVRRDLARLGAAPARR